MLSMVNIYTRQQFSQLNLLGTDKVHTPMNDSRSRARRYALATSWINGIVDLLT